MKSQKSATKTIFFTYKNQYFFPQLFFYRYFPSKSKYKLFAIISISSIYSAFFCHIEFLAIKILMAESIPLFFLEQERREVGDFSL
jgi:hypothetical protein